MFRKKVSEVAKTEYGNMSFEEKFNEISSKPAVREVRLKYKSCCGCGCSDIEIIRSVAYDSPLKDGDRATELLKTDRTA